MRTSSKYIAVNLEKNIYISLNEDDLKSCLQQSSDKIICKTNKPIFDMHSNGAPCEAKLLSHQNLEPCDVENASCKDAWLELHASNKWLVICCDTCTLRTICNGDVFSHTMTSSGIVSLPQGCVLQSNDLTIYAHNRYNSRVKLDYEIASTTFDNSVNKIVNLTYNYTPNLFQPTARETKIITKEIAEQKEQEKHFPSTIISAHDIHQYVITYLLLVAALVIGLVWVVRKHSHCLRKKKSHPLAPTEDIELQTFHLRHDRRDDGVQAQVAPPPKPARSVNTSGTNFAFSFD